MEALYPDIPRIVTAIAEITACLLYGLLLRRRGSLVFFVATTCIAYVTASVFLVATRDVPLFWWIPCMMAAIGIMYAYLRITLKAGALKTGYYCIRAFILAEFAASLEWQIACALDLTGFSTVWQGLLLLLIVYGAVFALAYAVEKRFLRTDKDYEISGQEFFSVLIVALLSFTFSNLSFFAGGTPFSGSRQNDIFNIRTIVDLAGLIILYAFQSRINELHAERELSAMHDMLQTQYDKYRSYQDSIDLINMKYHDLKHQIEGLKTQMSGEERGAWIKTMEQELSGYAPEMQTGNSVLDTMIDSRMVTCRKNNIRLTAVAEGALLNFMHVTDICTIFGNALDNAIESVITVEDEAQRLIHMTLSQKKDFVFISVENVAGQDLILTDGLPKTTKKDKKNHGFGLKSIRHTVEKYGGTFTVSAEGGWFRLNILLPAQEGH